MQHITLDTITKLYKSEGYLDKYFWSIFLFIFINIVELLCIIYISLKTHANEIKSNWAKERCKLNVIPFAGMIMEPTDMSQAEFTENNFIYCQQSIIQSIYEYITYPLRTMLEKLGSTYGDLINIIQSARILFAQIQSFTSKLIESSLNSIQALLFPLQQLFIVFQDISNKVGGVLTATMYVVMTIVSGIQAMFTVMVETIVGVFIILAAIIIFLFISPITLPVGLVLLTSFAVLSGHFNLILKFVKSVMGISPSKMMPHMPKKPKKLKFRVCFHPETWANPYKRMKDIKVGDMLMDGSEVKAVFILLAGEETFYTPKGSSGSLLLTSTHKVQYEGRWIPVKDHPDFVINHYSVPKYTPIVYCVNTSTKRIRFSRYTFLDWDEVESDQLAKTWYNNYRPPPPNTFIGFDSRLLGIVDLGEGNWQAINPFVEGDYDSHTEKYITPQ